MGIRGHRLTGISVLVFCRPNFFTGILVSVLIPVPAITGTGIGTDTESVKIPVPVQVPVLVKVQVPVEVPKTGTFAVPVLAHVVVNVLVGYVLV